MKQKLFTLLTLLLCVCSVAWGADFVDTYGAFGTVTGSYIGSGISKIALGENSKANSGIQADIKGTDLKFTVSVPTGFTIKTVVFKGDSNTSSVTCTDDPTNTLSGTITSTNTYTASSNVTSVTFTVGSASEKATKLTNFVVTVSSSTTDDYELITPASISDGNISYSSSLGDDKLVTAMAGIGGPSVGASDINFGNGKGFSITTSRAIKSVYCVWCQRAPINNNGWTGYSEAECTNSIGTYTTTTNAWVAPNDNTKYVAFKSSEGSTHKLSSIHIFYYNSNEPTVSASTVLITEDATDAGEILYTVDAKGTSGNVTASTEADWITLGAVDEVNNKVPFTATANSKSVSRSATVTLTYTYNTSETVTKDVTVTQEANVKGDIIKVTLNGGTSATVTGAIGGTADVQVQSDKKFGNGHYAGFTLAGGNTFHTGDIINVNIATNASGSGSIAIYDTDKSTVLYNTGTKGDVGDNTFTLPAACNGKSTLYICRTDNNGWNAVVNYIEVSRPVSVTIASSGYSSLGSAYGLDFANATTSTENAAKLTAFAATESSKTSVKLVSIDEAPAETGVILKGTAGATYTIPVKADAAALAVTNLLHAAVTATPILASTSYIMQGGKFHLVTEDSEVPAGKAYLVPGTSQARELTFFFDGETTGINVATEKKNTATGVYYNLAGQRVNQPTKGIYVVDGKKVIK